MEKSFYMSQTKQKIFVYSTCYLYIAHESSKKKLKLNMLSLAAEIRDVLQRGRNMWYLPRSRHRGILGDWHMCQILSIYDIVNKNDGKKPFDSE
jgi:hypothetical protein